MKKFYRVSNLETQQGLWYDFKGNFTGLIHDKFNFCQNNQLKMDFDEELIGYLSATPDLETLFVWFTKNDILQLQEHGYYIHEYKTDDYKFYERFQHHVINQEKSIIIRQIKLTKEDI